MVSLFLCGRREMFFILCSVLYTHLHSGYWNLFHASTPLPNQPNLHGDDTSLLLCSAEQPFCLVPCFTICFLSVSLIPSVWPGIPEKIMKCKWGLHWFTAQLPQACFLRGLSLSFFFLIEETYYLQKVLHIFFIWTVLSLHYTFWASHSMTKSRSAMPFIKVNRRYGETVQ